MISMSGVMEGMTMDTLAIIGPLFGLILFAAAAIGWGADSRDPMTDDHRR
jgi:hypothetical protein